jgi:hypothetical protein
MPIFILLFLFIYLSIAKSLILLSILLSNNLRNQKIIFKRLILKIHLFYLLLFIRGILIIWFLIIVNLNILKLINILFIGVCQFFIKFNVVSPVSKTSKSIVLRKRSLSLTRRLNGIGLRRSWIRLGYIANLTVKAVDLHWYLTGASDSVASLNCISNINIAAQVIK